MVILSAFKMLKINEIPKFKELLAHIVPASKKVSNFKVQPLTAPGDNYGSVLLAIDITLQDEKQEKEVLHTVAKFLPANDFVQEYMNTHVTFRNELVFYQTILPTLRNFQQQHISTRSLEFFPKFYTGRLSLDPSKKIADDNSIIVLENLKVAGFTLLDKQGFDLETTKFILTKVSEFHGTTLALKETQPNVFAEKVLPHFQEFAIFQMGPNVANDGFMTSELVINAITKIVENDDFCSPHMDRIRKTISTCVANLALPKNAQQFRQDVFACLIHTDLWINNIMVKLQNGKVVDLKLIDWQLFEYASVVKDIIFFLGTSAREDIFMAEFDSLITYYYESLIGTLEELNCSTTKFAFDVFQEELRRVAAEVAYFYVMIALPSILADGENVWAVHELSKERMLDQMQVSEICRKRICFITKKFIQKGWI